jgi:cytochrome c
MSPLDVMAEVSAVRAGEWLFNETCVQCHSTELGVTKIGPSLYNVVDQPAATDPKYSYSSVMRASGLTWTEETLIKFLSGPQAMIPCHQVVRKSFFSCRGIKMTFSGFEHSSSSKAIVAYLKSLKK